MTNLYNYLAFVAVTDINFPRFHYHRAFGLTGSVSVVDPKNNIN